LIFCFSLSFRLATFIFFVRDRELRISVFIFWDSESFTQKFHTRRSPHRLSSIFPHFLGFNNEHPQYEDWNLGIDTQRRHSFLWSCESTTIIGLNLIVKLSWGINNHIFVFNWLCVVGFPSLYFPVSSFPVHEKTVGCVSPGFDLLCVGRGLSRRISRKNFNLSNSIPGWMDF